MKNVIFYKGVEITVSSVTGMASASVTVNWPVFDIDQKAYNLKPKEEKLFGRLKNVKQWIDRGILQGMLIIN